MAEEKSKNEKRVDTCAKEIKEVLERHDCKLEIINAFGGEICIMVNEPDDSKGRA